MSAAGPLPSHSNGGRPTGFPAPRPPSAEGDSHHDRPFAHIDDLKARALTEGYNPASPISALLDAAERGLKQALTLAEWRRPELAFVEFLRASEIAGSVIPHHKDYTHLLSDQPEKARRLMLLQKRVTAAYEQFMNLKQIIINNNTRSKIAPRGKQNGHAGSDSAPTAYHGGSGHDKDMLDAQRVKPTPSPKPERLHARAISTATAGTNMSPPLPNALNERFANLRGNTAQRLAPAALSSDTPLNAAPLSTSIATNYDNRNSLDTLTRTNSLAARPQGPRGMPTGAPPPIQIPNLPQAPPAAYSPARNMQTTGNIALPRHSARSLASNRRTSMGPGSAASAYAPNGSAQNGDYFPTHALTGSRAPPPAPAQRRTSSSMPTEAYISTEKLYDYLNRFNILLIDFRSRDEFDEGHIYVSNVICIDPLTVRPGMSAEELGETLVLSPEGEQELFMHRENYDLVVYYDTDTQTAYPFASLAELKSAGLKSLHEALFDFNQEKPLQRPPVLLRGGIDAWIDMVGRQALLASSTADSVKASRQDGIRRRPLASASMNGSQLKVPKRRLRNYDELNPEEEQSWRERARAESVVLTQPPGLSADGQSGDEIDEQGTVQWAPDNAIKQFLERFPDAGELDPRAFASQLPSRPAPEPPAKVSLPVYPVAPPASIYAQPSVPTYSQPPPPTYPQAPARPAPAAPRMSYTGVSDRAVSGTTPATRSASGQLAPYIPPKYLANNLRLPRTGLVNFGNTCYMNATLQAMSATTPLSVFFLDDTWKSQRQDNSTRHISKGLMAENYANLVRKLWIENRDKYPPDTIRKFSAKINDAFNNGDQQDAKEYLDFLLEAMHEDLNATWTRTPLRGLTEQEEAKRERMPQIIVAKTEWGRYMHRELSFPNTLFGGQHASRLTCLTCRFTSTTYDFFNSISVEIPGRHSGWSGMDGSMPTLDDCLRSYCGEEQLLLANGNGWTCPRCRVMRNATKRLTLTRAPQCLIVHFKRFEGYGNQMRKIKQPVHFPLCGLDLAPYMLPQPTAEEAQVIARDYGPEALKTDAAMTPPYKYDAYAVVRHLGQTLRSGHYVTAARDSARKCWHLYDDDRVYDFDADGTGRGQRFELRDESAYIVFYGRVAPKGYPGKI